LCFGNYCTSCAEAAVVVVVVADNFVDKIDFVDNYIADNRAVVAVVAVVVVDVVDTVDGVDEVAVVEGVVVVDNHNNLVVLTDSYHIDVVVLGIVDNY
jgi:hypothetical protein